MDKLRRALGPAALIFYGVGVIIGAGIYAVIGAAAGEAQGGLWVGFLLAAIPACLAALSYAELSSMIPRAGAEYSFVMRALPDYFAPSFITGMVVALASTVTAATVALAFGGYIQLFLDLPIWIGALGLLGLCGLVCVAGIRESSWVTIGATTVEVVGLLLIIGAGFLHGSEQETGPIWHAGVVSATAMILFVYTGFGALANLAEEAKNPERDLPIALLVSLGLTTLLYILVALAVLRLASPEALAGSDAPLSLAGGAAAPWMRPALGWIALFSTANTALISYIAASRMLYGMAADGAAPALLSRVLPGRKTPWFAILVVFALSLCLLPLGQVAIVAEISSFASLWAFVAVHGALIALRIGSPDMRRPFRLPGRIGRVPVVPVLGIISVAVLMTQFKATVYLAGGAAVALVAVVYLFHGRAYRGRVRDHGTDRSTPHSAPAITATGK